MAATTAIYLIVILFLCVVVAYLLVERRRWVKTKEAALANPDPTGEDDSARVLASSTVELDQWGEPLSSFHQAMAQCPSSIIITGLDGCIQYVNQRFTETSGYDPEEVLGRNPRLLKSGNMDPVIYAELWATISAGSLWRGELENRKRTGQTYWELVSIAPIKDEHGKVLKYFAVKEDISEAKLHESEARRARLDAEAAEASDQAKAVFLKLIGQEMKNPLNRVLGFTNLLSQGEVNNDQLKHLNQVGAAGLELLALIDRILDFTSAETGTMELEIRPFKPAEVLDRVLKVCEQKAAARNILLRKEISESLPDYVVGDEKRFRQVIEPLLDNAVRYTFEGTIRFSMNASYNEAAQVWEFQGSVEDSGRGIPEKKLKELFRPFTQLEPGVFEGAGLGLALCQRLCQLQGGELEANSEVGVGSTFRFNLKLKPMDIDHAALRVSQGPEGKQFAKAYPIHILVAEDNRINRRLLETLMERLGYEASFALDGLGVLAEVNKRPYDLILMDLQMPNISGIEAARRIRNGEAGDKMKDVRIVAITAFASDENLEASKAVGMNAFLAKPFDISKIKMEIIHAYEAKKSGKVDAGI